MHVHTLVNIGGHEADMVLPTGRRPLVVEYDGGYWHIGNSELERRQRQSWERAGYVVVRLREPPLEPTTEWDLVLPTRYRSFCQHDVRARIVRHVLATAWQHADSMRGSSDSGG